MSIKHVTFRCVGTPDEAAMKAQLSAVHGIVEMNIDSKSHAVDVMYDESAVSAAHIASQVKSENYQMLP